MTNASTTATWAWDSMTLLWRGRCIRPPAKGNSGCGYPCGANHSGLERISDFEHQQRRPFRSIRLRHGVETVLIQDTSTPVLVLVSSQHGGLGAIRSLGRARIPVFSVHRNSWEPSSRSRYLQRTFCWDFASAPEARSVSFLLGVARQIGGRPMLVATCDNTARLLAENAEALREGFIFQSPPVDAA